jgi:hypothetical protein
MQNITRQQEEALFKIYECLSSHVGLDFDDIAEMLFAYSTHNNFSISYDSIAKHIIKLETITLTIK